MVQNSAFILKLLQQMKMKFFVNKLKLQKKDQAHSYKKVYAFNGTNSFKN